MGRTALVNAKVPRIAGLAVRNGIVDIPAGGVVETIIDNEAIGGLSIGGSGNVQLSGNGQLTVAGNVSNAGSLRITGPNAQVQFGGNYSMTGRLAADITDPNNHSIVNVAGDATLGGTLLVAISGAAPSLGQSFDLLKAGSLGGNFNAVDVSAAPTLARGLQYQVAQNNNTASLVVGNVLVLTVDRQNGSGSIENVVGEPIAITSYALRSENGLLSAENWSNAAGTGAAGEGWTVANPTVNHLAELNLSNSFSVDVGAKIELGNPYNGGPVRPAGEDLFFEYTTLDGSLNRGSVEYTGALNDFVLHVNPEDVAAAISNRSSFIETPDITSYAVRSESAALSVGSWTSFADSGQAGQGWTKANPSPEHIAELNLEDSKAFTNGTLISLGNIFSPGSALDLLFEYTTVAGDVLRGSVQYGEIPIAVAGGDCNGDGVVNANDLACAADIAERDLVLAALNTLPGDLNGNGDVAFADFLVLADNFGQSGVGYPAGDIDLEGTVAFADFLALADNFGKTPGAVAAAVPEPSPLVLLSGTALVTCGWRKRRKMDNDSTE